MTISDTAQTADVMLHPDDAPPTDSQQQWPSDNTSTLAAIHRLINSHAHARLRLSTTMVVFTVIVVALIFMLAYLLLSFEGLGSRTASFVFLAAGTFIVLFSVFLWVRVRYGIKGPHNTRVRALLNRS